MYTIEKDKKINQMFIGYHRLGLWHDESATVLRKIVTKLFFTIFFLTCSVSIALGIFLNDNISEAIFSAALAISCVVLMIKLSYILWKKDEILEFTNEMCTHSVPDLVQFNEINRKLKNFMKFATFLFWILIAALFFLFILSFVLWSERKLFIKIAFPLDSSTKIGYSLSHLWICCWAIFTFIIVSFGVIVWYLMLNCSIKYDVLGRRFRNMGSIEAVSQFTGKKSKMLESEKKKLCLEEFVGLIKTHQNLQGKIDRFKSFFSVLFFMQITTSGLCICFMIYGLIFADHVNLVQRALYSVAMFHAIFDVFMVMHFGNQIKLSSDSLSYCLFESNWMDQSELFKKCMIILTEVLKQPQELVIGLLYPLNLETFTSIMNFAYTTFNILQNFK